MHTAQPGQRWDVVIIGGGAAGIATAASLLKRQANLQVVIVEPSDRHYYQPAWTLVGGGAYNPAATHRPTASLIPKGAKWVRASARSFEPENNTVVLDDQHRLEYRALVVATGLTLNLDAIEGLASSLGQHGVTSNYVFEHASYTWQMVQQLTSGRALFTQPPMPIKCAGAPQKAMYLSCHHWETEKRLANIDVQFHNAGAVLFGVADFVPPLMEYVKRYNATLNFNSRLTAVDGPGKTAVFIDTLENGDSRERIETFDMLHVVPPQRAPECIRNSPLANQEGWVAADKDTLQHPKYPNIFTLGDVSGTANAKTAAAVRKQAPVVACNLLSQLDNKPLTAGYEGYGACPLTVEKGKVVLAEFGYGGVLQPSFPLNPAVARRSMWWLKTKIMPPLYFHGMLKGHEWLAAPVKLKP